MNRLAGLSFTITLLASASGAQALQLPPIQHAATVKECGACHMVYAPQLLPQRSWEALMGSLDQHFGENAKLTDDMRIDILAYLAANASDSPDSKFGFNLNAGVKPDAVPARVTEMPWWIRRHGEVNTANLAKTKIKTAGNCIGCHIGSDKTMVYNEPGD
jgi:Dihaem cytochrome c